MSDINYGDPNATPPMGQAIPLGLQHVLAMFASNVTPSIIVAGAAGLAFGGAEQVYLIQMAMLFAGVATLFQTVGMGPIGARLPIMQGTSFAFVGVLAGVAATQGLSVALTACLIAGLIHFALGSVIQKLRFMFPPLVTGLVILAIGLYLIPVAIKYAAGGAAEFQMAAESFGSLKHWTVALTVVVVSLACKFLTKGLISNAAVLIGLIAGYLVATFAGMVSFGGVAKAAWFQVPTVMPYGFEFSIGAVIGVTLVSVVSAIETVGDASATTKAGAGRDATDDEIAGATYADGLGTAVCGRLWRLAKHILQPKRWHCWHDRHYVASCGDNRRDYFDHLRIDPKNRGRDLLDAFACSRRRRDRDVRNGGGSRHEYVDRSQNVTPEHDYYFCVTCGRSGA
jgi:NCS2 family nucleobase:cation symporter-2